MKEGLDNGSLRKDRRERADSGSHVAHRDDTRAMRHRIGEQIERLISPGVAEAREPFAEPLSCDIELRGGDDDEAARTGIREGVLPQQLAAGARGDPTGRRPPDTAAPPGPR